LVPFLPEDFSDRLSEKRPQARRYPPGYYFNLKFILFFSILSRFKLILSFL